MKKIQKVSLVSMIGGSLFVADNIFELEGNRANALTQETSDRLRAQRAAKVIPTINLLLFDDDELAVNDSYTAQRNTLFTADADVGVLANDNLQPNSVLNLLQDVNHGSLTLNSDGSFEYLPNIDFTGSDSFTYSLITDNGQSDDATVSIRVNGTPDAIDDDFILNSNAAFQDSVVINIVGGSDTVFDGAQVVKVVNEATLLGGIVSIQANGDFQYTPPVDLGNRQDSFVYTLLDSDGETDTATITWQIGVSFIGLDQPFTVPENQTLDSQFEIITPSGLQSLTINGMPFTLAQLNALSGSGLSISGEQFGEFTITEFTEMTGVLKFSYDPTGISQNHANASSDVLTDTITISVLSSGFITPFDTQLVVNVMDTSPVANNDNRSISEGTSAIAGNTVGVAGSATGDNQDSIVDPNAQAVSGVGFGSSTGIVGTNLAGDFGVFLINSAGIYTYTLDNTSAAVQALKNGESITDVFTYTITDGDGDTDSANFTVTINGVDDALPIISVVDQNGGAAGQQSVTEKSGDSVNGVVNLNATAGIKAVTVGGQDVLNASNEAVTIIGSDGRLEVTSFNAGVFSYTYTEDGTTDDHSAGAVVDQFSIAISDNEDDTATDTLAITIDDTQPLANADTNTVMEDAASNTVTGDLLLNDVSGADTPLAINDINIGGSQELSGLYGSLTINASGTYSYSLSNDAAAVQTLRSGDSITDVFSYTLTDADQSTSSSELTVTILGLDEPPVINVSDNNGSQAGDQSVAENSSTSGTFVINAEAGLTTTNNALQLVDEQNNELNLTLAELQSLAVNNQSLVAIDGAIVLTGFSTLGDDSTISYTFEPTGNNRNHASGDESVIEMFSISAIDALGNAAPVEVLGLLITDTAPTAAVDTATVTEDAVPSILTGDVLTNDTAGADTAISVVGVDLNGPQSVGIPFDSDYGTLDLNSDGTYTYTLDNNNSTVQSLNAGESLTESFSYTIVDTDGDESSTNLFVTINGANEPPSIIIPDANGASEIGDFSVQENLISSGFFTITAADGLATLGPALQVFDEDNDVLSLNLVQLQNLTTTNQTLVGTDGTLTLNGYSNAGDDHTVGFSFNPTGSSRDHSGGDIVEMFSITATDQLGRPANSPAFLDVLISDTNPSANNDARSIIEGTSAIAGNVVGGQGAATGDVSDTLTDQNTNPVTDVDFGATDGSVGTNLAGAYGSFVISSSGVYTYTLDNTSADVQGLKNGESLTDVFTYTITDGDGDTDSADITVTINGFDDPLPTIILADGNGSAAGQQSVVEDSGASVDGTVTLAATAGIQTVTVGGQNVPNGSTGAITITGIDGNLAVSSFNSGTNTFSYTYTEDGAADDHSLGAVTDQFIIAISDSEGDTDTDTLSITINDTDASAVPDTDSITEDEAVNVITGNVFDNDTGADSKTLTQYTFSGGSQTLGALITTNYGEFTLSSGGNFTYTLNNSDPDTNLLNTGDMVTETFSYTLTDFDGDTSSSTLSITINGVDDV